MAVTLVSLSKKIKFGVLEKSIVQKILVPKN